MDQMLCSCILNWNLYSFLDSFFNLNDIANSESWSTWVSKNREYMIVYLESNSRILGFDFLKLLSVDISSKWELFFHLMISCLLFDSFFSFYEFGSQRTIPCKTHDPALNDTLGAELWSLSWRSALKLSDQFDSIISGVSWLSDFSGWSPDISNIKRRNDKIGKDISWNWWFSDRLDDSGHLLAESHLLRERLVFMFDDLIFPFELLIKENNLVL